MVLKNSPWSWFWAKHNVQDSRVTAQVAHFWIIERSDKIITAIQSLASSIKDQGFHILIVKFHMQHKWSKSILAEIASYDKNK